MGTKRARMSAEEVDFICGVRRDGKTHKDYNKATGRDNYLFRLTDDEFKVLAKYRDVQEEAQEHEYNYAGMIAERNEKAKKKIKEKQIEGQLEYLLQRNAILEETLGIKQATADVEIYELKPLEKSGGMIHFCLIVGVPLSAISKAVKL